jgi:iron complex transport system substrate-binding protein
LRIVSLLPSATEIMCALGLGDQLVGVTHECDFPPEVVKDKPVVTGSTLSAPQHAEYAENTDEDRLCRRARLTNRYGRRGILASRCTRSTRTAARLKPDLVLTQGLCDVCAVTHKAVVAAVDALGGTAAQVLDLAPTSLAGVLQSIREVGAATGKQTEADALVAQIQARWDAVRARADQLAERPRTLLLEWPDPPFSAATGTPN